MENKIVSVIRGDRRWLALLLALVLFFGGLGLARGVETSWGDVQVTRLSFQTDDGATMSAKFYLPDGVSAANPAPAILVVPGGNASLENMSALTIEFSRRGYVVMSIDPFQIGRSEVIDTAAGAGAASALNYLRSLAFVDEDNIGLIGHSAGSGRVLAAATEDGVTASAGVKAMLGMGAGFAGLEPALNVNVGVIIGSFDNTYGQGVQSVRDINTSEAYKDMMQTDYVEFGTWYGDFDGGSGRILYTAFTGHMWVLLSPTAINHAVDFMAEALTPAPHAVSGVVFLWKEMFTAIAMVGCIVLLFPVGSWLLDSGFFGKIKRSMPTPVSKANGPFWFYFIVPAVFNSLIAAWAVFNGQNWLNKLGFLRISNVNGFIFWFMCSTMFSLTILALRFKFDKGIDKGRLSTHARESLANVLKALSVAVICVFSVYTLIFIGETLFGLDPRFWKAQLNLLTGQRVKVFFTYLPIYVLCFGVFSFSQTIGLRIAGTKPRTFTFLVWLSSTLPAAIFLIYVYGTIFATGLTPITNVQMSRANGAMINCVLTYFATCKVTTYFYRKTGSFYTGAFINGILMTWMAIGTDLITAL